MDQNHADVIDAIVGPRLIIPLSLVRRLGLEAAAFLARGVFLTSISRKRNGWFFAGQEGNEEPERGHFQSWEYALGIKKDRQLAIRRQLAKLGLVEEEKQGTPCRLFFRFPPERFLAFLEEKTEQNPQFAENRPTCRGKNGQLVDRKSRDKSPGFPSTSKEEEEKKEKTKRKNHHRGAVGGGSNLKTQPHSQTTALEIFLEAAGRPPGLNSARLLAVISGASPQQAHWAGAQWQATVAAGKSKSPEALAMHLCQQAAAGRVGRPASVAVEEQNAATAALQSCWGRLKALAGQRFLTPEGDEAEVAPSGSAILLPNGSVAGKDALRCLQKIEAGEWVPA